jgi:hypothetical protein
LDSRPEQVIGNLLFFMLDLIIRNFIMTVSKGMSIQCSCSQFDSIFFVTGRVNSMRYRDYRYTKATICITIAAGIISACSPGLFTYKGDKVTQKNRMILLQQGEQQGVWKTDELAVTYQYQMTPDALKLTGCTDLVGGFALGFSVIQRLAVYLLFLDKQGTVIESPLIYSAGMGRAIDTIPMVFERTIPIPEGVQAISFAYEGELTGSGTDDSTFRNIWSSPSRP